MRSGSVLLCLLACTFAGAQEVREESPFGSSATAFRRAAEDQGFDWPNFKDGDRGTVVRVTFDARNADFTVVTEKSYGEANLLRTMQRLTASANLPKADFITMPSRTSTIVDVELNDYLSFPDKWHTEYEMPMGALLALLEKTDLPKPIVVGIEGDDTGTVVVKQPGKPDASVKDYSFFKAKDLAEQATAQFKGALSPWGYLVLAIMAAVLGTVVFLPLRLFRNRPKVEPPSEKTPEEVQSEYDKKKPAVFRGLLPVLPAFLILIGMRLPGAKAAMASAMMLLPHSFISYLPLVMAGVMIPAFGFGIFYRRRKDRAENPEAQKKDDAELRTFRFSMLPLAIGMFWVFGIFILMQTWPGFYRLNLSATTLRVLIFGPAVVALILSIYFSSKASKSSRRILQPGDQWYDKTMEFADRAKVKVRRVMVTKVEAVNAFANIFNDVGLTQGLLDKMEPEEIEAVIAHELGHHKAVDPKRLLLFSLLFLLGWLLFVNFPLEWLADRYHWDRGTTSLLNGPLFIIFLLPILQSLVLGKQRRRYEQRADAYAAWLMNDKEVVIRALTKMTQINQSPARLKPIDEVMSSHPSLVNRIEALRQLDLSTFEPGRG